MSKVSVSDEQFDQEVLEFSRSNPDTPVIVDFWATWCGPCKMIGSMLDTIQSKLSDSPMKIVAIESEEGNSTFGQYKVQSVPTLVFIKNGNEVDRLIGMKSANEIEKKILSL